MTVLADGVAAGAGAGKNPATAVRLFAIAGCGFELVTKRCTVPSALRTTFSVTVSWRPLTLLIRV